MLRQLHQLLLLKLLVLLCRQNLHAKSCLNFAQKFIEIIHFIPIVVQILLSHFIKKIPVQQVKILEEDLVDLPQIHLEDFNHLIQINQEGFIVQVQIHQEGFIVQVQIHQEDLNHSNYLNSISFHLLTNHLLHDLIVKFLLPLIFYFLN